MNAEADARNVVSGRQAPPKSVGSVRKQCGKQMGMDRWMDGWIDM